MIKFFNSNRLLIGLILLTIIVMIYSYYTRIPIDDNELITVTGNLADKPIESSTGGDMPWYFIKFRLYNDENTYYFKNCGYYSIDKEYVLSLKADDFVSFKILQSDKGQSGRLNIYTFATKERPETLTLDSYNYCNINYWERLRPFLVIMLSLLLIRIFLHLKLLDIFSKTFWRKEIN